MKISNVEIYWCKMDKLRDKFRATQGKEWSIEAANISLEVKKQLKDAGVLSRVKNKMDERGDFLHFTISEYQRPRLNLPNGKYDLWDFDKQGSLDDALAAGYEVKKNELPPIYRADGKTPWDFKTDGLIGNKSKADFKFNISGPNIYLVAIRVTELVPYETDGDYEDPNDWGDDETVATEPKSKKKPATVLEALAAPDDDEIPF